jgi:ABC-type dipeptide/oligopeptide/nickel transport system permease subunit
MMPPVEPAPHASPIAAPGARHDLLVAWSSVALMLVAFVGVTVAIVSGVIGGWFALTNLVGFVARFVFGMT